MTSRALLVVSLKVWALHALAMSAATAASVPAYEDALSDGFGRVGLKRALVHASVSAVAGVLMLWKAGALARVLLPDRSDRPVSGRGIFETAAACVGATALMMSVKWLLAVVVHPYSDVWDAGNLMDTIGDADGRSIRYAIAGCIAGVLAMATPRFVALLRRRTSGGAQ